MSNMMYGVCASNGPSGGSTGVMPAGVVPDHHNSHPYHHTQHNGQSYSDPGYPDCAFYYPTTVPNYSSVSEGGGGTEFLLDGHPHPPHSTNIKAEPYCPPPLLYNHHHQQYEMSSPDQLLYNYNPSAPPTGRF